MIRPAGICGGRTNGAAAGAVTAVSARGGATGGADGSGCGASRLRNGLTVRVTSVQR
jgi:hypothetical protein